MDIGAISLLLGAFLPVVIDLFNKKVTNSNWRFVISLILSLILGGIVVSATGGLAGVDLSSAAGILAAGSIVFASAQTIYKTYWADSNARLKLYGKEVAKR